MRNAQSHSMTNSGPAPPSFPLLQSRKPDFSKSICHLEVVLPPHLYRVPPRLGAATSPSPRSRARRPPPPRAVTPSLRIACTLATPPPGTAAPGGGGGRRRRTAACEPGATFPPLLSPLTLSEESPLRALQERVADGGGPGNRARTAPAQRRLRCCHHSGQGSLTEAVSKGSPAAVVRLRVLLNFPS